MVGLKRPIARYHGGKWSIARWVIEQFPDHEVYCEPYSGIASVLLHKERSREEIVNDLDGDVCNLLRMLRDRPAELARVLTLTPYAREEFVLSYEPSEDPLERARRLVARLNMGFGSTSGRATMTGFRSYSGHGRISAHEWATFPPIVQTIAERLQGVLIENLPAMDIIPKYDSPRTLFYVDPPYVPHTRSSLQHASGKKQYAHEMGDAEHRSLAIMLQACAGYVVISGYPSPLYDNELYFDWKRVERKAMTCHQEKTEVLWTKPALVR